MSNYLGWAVIPLVLMIVAAPIFYVLPSSRDKYLTALRLMAKNSGCLVKMASLDKLDVDESERVSSSGRVVQPKYRLIQKGWSFFGTRAKGRLASGNGCRRRRLSKKLERI